MAENTPAYIDRIVQDPSAVVAKPIIKGTNISVELVLERLAARPDVAQLVAEIPPLTVDDVRAVLSYARARIAEPPSSISPQDFYGEASQRSDIRRILDALAT
jgi:uncharacterized protein (DUF433 family)